MDYSAVGQTTHLAARMEQLATPGSIRLTAAMLRLVEGLVRVNALGPVPVKGMAEPVDVFALIGASASRGRLQAAIARGLTRFVGREREIDALSQALERAGAGHGQVVAAVGEAGVGKSRLAYEFVHSHHTEGWLVLESASVSYGKATPYFPIIDLLRRYAHVEEHDDARTIRAKVTGQLLTLDDSLQEAIPAFLSLLDVLPEGSLFQKLDPPQRRQRTLDALKRVLLRESQVQPLVLVFEDLHWIDSETQALLDRLIDSLPTGHILLLANYRPEYQHGWGGKTYYTQLRLDPLPPAGAEELLQALLGNDPTFEPLKQLLVARTEGNPFFLEESVRALVETEVLVGEPGAHRLVKPLDSLQVPTTVQAVLAARIDRLPSEDKRLLQTAAVIGTEVPLPLLQAIAELTEAALHRALAHLQAAEFLYETRLFPEYAYTFKHALTHEVAYGSLLQERRRALHARIVGVSEELAGERVTEQVERLAYHAVRGEVWDKALAYCRQAGEKAMARSAHREAVGCFEQALTSLCHLPNQPDSRQQAIDLHLGLRSAWHLLGDFGRVLLHLRTAEPLAESLGDNHRRGLVSYALSNYFWQMGRPDQAFECGRRALALATDLGDVDLQMLANEQLGATHHVQGDYNRAIVALSKIVVTLEGSPLQQRIVRPHLAATRSCANWVMCLAELGAFAEGNARGADAVRLAEAADSPYGCCLAYLGVGYLHLRKGDLHQAIPMLERGLELCQTVGIPLAFPWLAPPLGAAYTLSGRAAESLPLLEQATEQAADMCLRVW
jgi:tetratricopeptide (TPR) repeat protein